MTEYSYTYEVAKYSRHLKEPERQKYVNEVYRFLMALEPGKKIELDKFCKAATRDLFIEVIKMYIEEQRWPDVEFTEDYQTVRKMN
jgi:hypothetical protein